jgi:hypothetical protein
MLFPASLVSPITNRHPSLARDSSAVGRPGVQAKRIFIIRQTTSFPPRNSAAGKNVQHILIFDDHPESLRLVLGQPATPYSNHSVPRGVTLWVILFSMLMLGLLIAMFWPLL